MPSVIERFRLPGGYPVSTHDASRARVGRGAPAGAAARARGLGNRPRGEDSGEARHVLRATSPSA
jgi:hypothetical protein